MVHDILRELDAGLTRRQARELTDLHRLRDATRAVQARQRALRAQRREKRRALEHAADPPTAAALTRTIEGLNEAIAAARSEERSLAQSAAGKRDQLNAPTPAPVEVTAAEIGAAVARSVCKAGTAFDFLTPGQHVNVLVRQPEVSRYYVFAVERVQACSKGDVTPAALLAESFSYES